MITSLMTHRPANRQSAHTVCRRKCPAGSDGNQEEREKSNESFKDGSHHTREVVSLPWFYCTHRTARNYAHLAWWGEGGGGREGATKFLASIGPSANVDQEMFDRCLGCVKRCATCLQQGALKLAVALASRSCTE